MPPTAGRRDDCVRGQNRPRCEEVLARRVLQGGSAALPCRAHLLLAPLPASTCQAFRSALSAVEEAVGRRTTQAEIQTQQATDAEESVDPVCEALQDAADEWRECGRGNLLTDKARQLGIDCVRLAKELRTAERKALEGRDAVFQQVAAKRFAEESLHHTAPS